MTTPAKSSSNRKVRRHFSILAADETTIERGIPVTTVPRTIFDLAAVSSPEVVESALRESEYLRLYDRLSLLHLLERHPGHRGNRAIRRCIQHRREAPGHARSWLEERFLSFLDLHRLPRPQLNAWIEVGGRTIQVDCLWSEASLVVELDGFAAHGTRMAFREDRARDRRLRAASYGVTRIAPEQLEEEAEEIAADLRALLRSPKYKRS